MPDSDALDVLVWVGSCADPTLLESLVAVDYSPDGDFVGSQFSRTVGLGRYTDAMREVWCGEPSTSFEDLLEGASYLDRYLPRLIAEVGPETEPSNAVARFYDAQARHDLPDFSVPGVTLRYIGRFSYG
jgi:hypothetical protein